MASYRKRGDRWTVEVYVRGERRTKTCRTKAEARAWAEEIEERLRSGRAGGRQTLRAAMEKYREEVSPTKPGERWETVRLKRFERDMVFADDMLVDVQPDQIAAWRDQRLREVGPGSVLRELTLLSSVWEMARREWRWTRENPVRDVRKPPAPPAREQLVSEEQAVLIFAVARYQRGVKPETVQQMVAAAFDLALETAMRAGEIRGLTGDCIFLEKKYVRLPKTKNGSQRDVPLSRAAVAILEPMDRGRPFPIEAGTFDATFRKLRRRAGLEGQFTFHDSRATAITRMAKRLDIHDLARATGHRDLRQLLRYYRATASDIAGRLD
ncbi:tyrosine-type recombinase/integrase [Algiphilus aromaticivorans]|uniref:tyrosine-type recombinase/integrase n=1 Tax=Algiphilus aromaticivorans TaxID=382454 RepID=UPI0005C1D2C0|nr:site-specific integrase [Algiphilus aromaticivorans]